MSQKTELGNAVINVKGGSLTRLTFNALKSRYAEELGKTVGVKEFLEHLFDLKRERIQNV